MEQSVVQQALQVMAIGLPVMFGVIGLDTQGKVQTAKRSAHYTDCTWHFCFSSRTAARQQYAGQPDRLEQRDSLGFNDYLPAQTKRMLKLRSGQS